VGEPDEPLRVVDDHPVYRDGLAMLLGSVPGLAVVGAAADGAAAIALAREEQPDVVVMDVQMPVLDGIEATRRITSESPSVGVVVLMMSEDDGTVFAAVRAGARGYLLKGADQEEVVRAITTVASGGAVFGPALARRIAEFFAAARAVHRRCFRS
jgi:DNA-binding NarL/FixJ family response regulator